jgi:hypothetical protein
MNGDVPSKYLVQNLALKPVKEIKAQWHDNWDFSPILVSEVLFPFCFDELGGHNDRKLNIYGNEIYPMSLILKAHYEKQIKCHAITNYNLEDLEKLYGGEVIDRMKEMFTIVKFKGGSRRK